MLAIRPSGRMDTSRMNTGKERRRRAQIQQKYEKRSKPTDFYAAPEPLTSRSKRTVSLFWHCKFEIPWNLLSGLMHLYVSGPSCR